MSDNEMLMDKSYKIILTIVKKGTASKVVLASKKAGASGGTIMLGRGTASKSIYTELLGINFDPEKEIILTFVKEDMVDAIMQVILDAAKLNKPGNGVSFVLSIKGPKGVVHLNKSDNQQ